MKKSEIKDIYNESRTALQLIKAKCQLLPYAKDIDELALTIAEDIRLFFPVVKKTCDYIIDDGSEDFNELLQEINKEMRQIESNVAKFGYSKARFVLLQNCRAIINNIKDVEIWTQQPQPETPQQTNNGSDVEKAGRKKKKQPEAKKPKTFRDRVTGGNETLPQILHKLMDGKSGKDALIYLVVSIKNGKCQSPTYEQAKEEFGNFTGRANYYRYLDFDLYTKEEIEAASKAIKEAADTL